MTWAPMQKRSPSRHGADELPSAHHPAWAWPHPLCHLDLATARIIVQEYAKHRPLPPLEQYHLYDVYKLSILFDCVWCFARGGAADFYEKRKIEALARLGREGFLGGVLDS